MAPVGWRTAAVAAFLSLFGGTSVAAQPVDQSFLPSQPITIDLDHAPNLRVIDLSVPQLEALNEWTRAFADWQEWSDRWLNRRQRGRWVYAVERNRKPDPPSWLDDACVLVPDDPLLVRPCELLRAWREDLATTISHRVAVAAAKHGEAPTKSVWWRHVHVDGLWSTTQSNVTSFGIFGAHLTVDVQGRFQAFAAPGILLVSVPSLLGERQLTAATDWGVSYRLFTAGQSTVHFNLVHAWMLGNRANLLMPNVTLAGFSVSFQPRVH
jgi:hypothetical protein